MEETGYVQKFHCTIIVIWKKSHGQIQITMREGALKEKA